MSLDPAEMIGIKPKPLALSLYENLITNEIWSKVGQNYEYKLLNLTNS